MFDTKQPDIQAHGERNLTRQSLIYTELTRTIEETSEWAIPMSAGIQQP
jgi:hypothetical protein